MSESVEKQARKALRRMVFWRIVGELFLIPQAILGAIQLLATALGAWVHNVEMTIFYLELDAARRYKLLTGSDLAAASSAPGRYGFLLNPDLTDDAQREFIEARMREDDDDD